ncbi:MAG: hypothetical protein COB30_003580 [Ectothiorhodospiraceae bacterium]|nr:hypothetical protein [Ectothiorhodospiraceae bacterium]
MSDYAEMSIRSIKCFANDGKLDLRELNGLVDIAIKDGGFDDDEKRVLKNIISKLSSVELTTAMRLRISELEKKYGF